MLVSVAAVISDPTFSYWCFSRDYSVSGCHDVRYLRPFDLRKRGRNHGIGHKNGIYFITWNLTEFRFNLKKLCQKYYYCTVECTSSCNTITKIIIK